MGIAVATLRRDQGLSRAELAEKIEARQADVEALERGEINADWAALRELAKVLGLPLDALVELAEESAPGEGGEEWRRWSREAEQEWDAD